MSRLTTQIVAQTEELLRFRHNETLQETTPQRLHECLGEAVMRAISESWLATQQKRSAKRQAFYFSAEYLVGRLVYSNLFNMGLLKEMQSAFAEKGVDLSCMEEIEDAALGNGGLGRLAACFLDSAATCDLPLTGYGLRYRFGLFRQSFVEGSQQESADDWTKFGDPWSLRRDNLTVKVEFADQTVNCVPYDMPVIGYGTDTVGTLRLWQCEAEEDLQELYTSLLDGASWHKADHYYILRDFESYRAARLQANRDYRDRIAFGRKCLLNVASSGKFSSDRTIREYAHDIWHL